MSTLSQCETAQFVLSLRWPYSCNMLLCPISLFEEQLCSPIDTSLTSSTLSFVTSCQSIVTTLFLTTTTNTLRSKLTSTIHHVGRLYMSLIRSSNPIPITRISLLSIHRISTKYIRDDPSSSTISLPAFPRPSIAEERAFSSQIPRNRSHRVSMEVDQRKIGLLSSVESLGTSHVCSEVLTAGQVGGKCCLRSRCDYGNIVTQR